MLQVSEIQYVGHVERTTQLCLRQASLYVLILAILKAGFDLTAQVVRLGMIWGQALAFLLAVPDEVKECAVLALDVRDVAGSIVGVEATIAICGEPIADRKLAAEPAVKCGASFAYGGIIAKTDGGTTGHLRR